MTILNDRLTIKEEKEIKTNNNISGTILIQTLDFVKNYFIAFLYINFALYAELNCPIFYCRFIIYFNKYIFIYIKN